MKYLRLEEVMNKVMVVTSLFLVLAGLLSASVKHDSVKSLKMQHKKARLSRNHCKQHDLSCHRHYLKLIKELENRIDVIQNLKSS